MNAPESIAQAVQANQPRAALQRVMQRWLEAGMERQEILEALETAQQALRAGGNAEQTEWVAELLDGLDGWCRI